MFQSMRWRLVLSYILITLLTTSLIGVLALSLLQRSIQEQAIEHLTANAEGIARQALPLVQPLPNHLELEHLARTASFLGNAQVRILDAEHQVLANSGLPTEANAFIWFVTSSRSGVLPSDEQLDLRGVDGLPIVILPHIRGVQVDVSSLSVLERLPPDMGIVVSYRTEHPWGSSFIFDERYPVSFTSGLSLTENVNLQQWIERAAVSRSQHVVTVPIGDSERPNGYVEISRGLDVSQETLATARQAFRLASGGALLLAALVGLWVSQRLVAPIRGLTSVTNRMAGGDLAVRAPRGGRDEIGQLSRQFNQMAEQLEASFAALAAERDSLRRLFADASHELRTPITALRSFNELLQDGAVDEAAARNEFLAESAAQIERLEWITSRLLDLARLDAGLTALEMAPCTAGELLTAVVAPFRVRAEEAGVTLTLEPPQSEMALVCDRERVLLALSNLLDNACKFTTPGGTVTLGAEPAGTSVRFWVQDTGPGIPVAEQERVFERFYRAARVEGGVPGSGLGLGIVRSVAAAHGGRAAVTSTVGQGSRFTLEIPAPSLPETSRPEAGRA